MKNLVIINDTQEAENYALNYNRDDALVLSTNINAGVFLKEKYHIECKDFISFINISERIEIYNESGKKIDDILAFLDQNISPTINKRFGLNMKFFKSLYGIFGKMLFITYSSFLKSIKKNICFYQIGNISYYNKTLSEYLFSNTSIKDLLNIISNDSNITIDEFYLEKKKSVIMISA
jgi:hypothetical protein